MNNYMPVAHPVHHQAGQFFVGFGLMLSVAIQMRFLATAYDHDFTLLAIGAGVLGLGVGQALAHWLVPEGARDRIDRRASFSMMASGLALSGGLMLLPYWPLGTVHSFILLIIGFAVPFAACGYGLAFIWRVPGGSRFRVAWLLGGAIALLLSGSMLDYFRDLKPVVSIGAVMIGIGALLIVGRKMTVELGIGALLICAAAVYVIASDQQLEPAWSGKGVAAERPLYGQLYSGRLVTEPKKLWSGAHRTDMLVYRWREKGLGWVFTDAAVPVPVIGNDVEPNRQWLENNFPVVAIPGLISQPERVLTIGVLPGPEAFLASAQGAREVRSLGYNADASGLVPTLSRDSEVAGVDIRYTSDIRGDLARETKKFDLVVLPIPHVEIRGRVSSNLADRYLYTAEGMYAYWERVRAGGVLAVTTSDDTLFVRATLSVWNMLQNYASDEDRSYTKRSWGMRILPSAPIQDPYKYLLIVAKGGAANDMPARLQKVLKGMPVEALFGPGLASDEQLNGGLFGGVRQSPLESSVKMLMGSHFLAKGHYAGLYQLGSLARVEEVMTQLLSRDRGHWISVTPATDERPVFFDILPGQRPDLKWLFSSALLIVVTAVLFAMPSRRRPEVLYAQQQGPAVAVYLVYFALLGAMAMMTLVGLLAQSVRLPGMTVEIQEILLATVMTGMVIPALTAREHYAGWLRVSLPLLIAMLLVGLMYWVTGPMYSLISGWPAQGKWLIVTGIGVSLGTVIAYLGQGVLTRLAADSPAITPWACLILGAAALAGVVLAQWWVASWGWPFVWATLCLGYAVLLALGLWLWVQPAAVASAVTAGSQAPD